MNFFRNLESKIESLVEGGFKTAFKSEVQPVELARRLAKEMDANRSVSVSRTYVPNEYTVYLSAWDHAHFEGYEEGLKRELSSHLLEHARKRSYSLISRPVIQMEVDSDLDVGYFGIQARLVDAPPAEQAEAGRQGDFGHTMVYSPDQQQVEPPRDAPVTSANLIYGERTFPLVGRQMIVGRGREADIQIDDPNVSRQHAEIFRDGSDWVIRDLGSTNGTRVGGSDVTELPLRDGDELELGTVILTFRAA